MADNNNRSYRDLLAELNKSVTDKATAATRDRVALRDAVCGLVAVAQARGTPLIIIIETVDSMLRHANGGVADGSAAPPQHDGDLAKRLVEWCVQFRGD